MNQVSFSALVNDDMGIFVKPKYRPRPRRHVSEGTRRRRYRRAHRIYIAAVEYFRRIQRESEAIAKMMRRVFSVDDEQLAALNAGMPVVVTPRVPIVFGPVVCSEGTNG